MYLLPASDIHLEFELYDKNGGRAYPDDYFRFPKRSTDGDTVLLLLGDIGLVDRKYTLFPFLSECCAQFKHVFYVLGNHEHYHGSINTSLNKVRKYLADECLTNITVMENDCVDMFGYRFIGTTLWTDCNKGNPIDSLTIGMGVSDYKHIRTGTTQNPYLRKLRVNDTVVKNLNAVAYIEDRLKSAINDDIPAIVLTHHLPSYKSVHPKYDGDVYNCAYASDLDQLIMTYQPKMWFHGHTHDSMDYKIGDTRIMCNPRGYYLSEMNDNFEPEWLIEV